MLRLMVWLVACAGTALGFVMPFSSRWRGSLSASRLSEIVLAVDDPLATRSFYTDCIGCSIHKDSIQLVKGTSLFLLKNDQSTNMGVNMLGFVFSRDESTLQSILSDVNSTDVVLPLLDNCYGPSMVPDEDEELTTPARYAVLCDPNRLPVELHHDNREWCQIRLRVIDFADTIDFYTNILQMKLLRKRSNIINRPPDASFSAYLGNEDERQGPLLHLYYQYGTDNKFPMGNAFQRICFQSDNISAIEDNLRSADWAFEKNNENSISLKDPNGYQIIVHGTEMQPA